MKLSFIDESFPRPAIGSINFELWRHVDLMPDLWLAIQARYGRTYLTKVTKLWNELSALAPVPECRCGGCSCGINKAIDDLTSSTQLMQFLMVLHDSFNNERSQILMLDPLPDIEKTFSMVYAVEEQRSVHNDLEINSTHMACQLDLNDNRRSIDRLMEQKKSFVDKRKLLCTHCRKKGHARDSCFQLHGVPEWYKMLGDKKKKGRSSAANIENREEAANTSSQNVADIVAEVLKVMQKNTAPSDPLTNLANYAQFDDEFEGNNVIPTEIDENCWIVDSGASNHVCANIALFHSYIKSARPHFIHLPDGLKRLVQYIGTVKLNSNINLENVLFVPLFSVNLLSDQDTKDSLVMRVLFKWLYIYKQNPRVSTEFSHNSFHNVSCSASFHCNVSVWHNRLGHASVEAIKHIQEVDCTEFSSNTPCDTCHKAKQSRIPFPVSSSHAAAIFDLVHMDFWEKSSSNCTSQFLLHGSESVWKKDKNFLFRQWVRVYKSMLCANFGILHQTSCSYTPQQNDRVERKHRHLLNIARVLLLQASLPIKFWCTTPYLINQTPTEVLGWKTPYEKLYGKDPQYNHLRNFGSLCYATDITPHKSKFHSRAILIGYAMHQKAYKLFDLDNPNVLFSRDVHFYEGVFPNSSSQSDEPSLPMPTVTLQSDNMLDASSQPATLTEQDDLPASNLALVP
ncbi:hypothetical protein Sango_1157700 [Sesamum angolense]|uniref:Integrase catalytic domain-containing protein n=1 Tax=Sesamum angolense TaxID=2727404 RepID=A0AAE1WW51_9LAMI|nr:hypothetical protein Sango_1157700 [Sesamum angolense]